jgi:hypothetical protein
MASGTSSAGKAGGASERPERGRQEIHRAGPAEHPDGHEDAHQERDDADGDLEAFPGPFDEHVVDLHAPEDPDERDRHEQHGDGPRGNGLERGAHHSPASASPGVAGWA